MSKKKQYKYFTLSEFDSPDLPGSGSRMKSYFIEKLDAIREEYGQPMVITSGYRTPEHNSAVGGVNGSAHVNAVAADIAASNTEQKLRLMRIAKKHGIKRMGWGKGFVHLDMDSTKQAQNVVWGYTNSNPPLRFDEL